MDADEYAVAPAVDSVEAVVSVGVVNDSASVDDCADASVSDVADGDAGAVDVVVWRWCD